MTTAHVRLRIDAIAAGGDGIGRADGLAVFVPRTAPGDTIEAEVRVRGRLGRGELVQLIERSLVRLAPQCPHYEGDDCGGCQLQHLAYAAQLDAKRGIVQDAFVRIARRDVDVSPVVASPRPWRYRSRLTLAMRRRGREWRMGMHSRRDVDEVFALHTCVITDDRVVEGWRRVAEASVCLPDAVELRGTVRLLGDRLGLVIEGGEAWQSVDEFARRCTDFAVIRWRPARGGMQVIVDRAAPGEARERFDQVNREVATLAKDELVRRALENGPGTAIDAYAGSGDTAASLAAAGVRVTAIELDAEAVEVAAGRLRAPSRAVRGRVEQLLPRLLPADVVVVNPPRAGLDARVTEVLESKSRPARLLYMSCDPATLARDVGRLPGWRVTSVQPYDMFPQTAHVEVVAELVPEAA